MSLIRSRSPLSGQSPSPLRNPGKTKAHRPRVRYHPNHPPLRPARRSSPAAAVARCSRVVHRKWVIEIGVIEQHANLTPVRRINTPGHHLNAMLVRQPGARPAPTRHAAGEWRRTPRSAPTTGNPDQSSLAHPATARIDRIARITPCRHILWINQLHSYCHEKPLLWIKYCP